MAKVSKKQFIRDYSRKLRDGNAAIFAGAGLSRASGFVDWKALLKEIAEDLGLNIDQEHDLIAVAQYHVTQLGGRDRINELLVQEFSQAAQRNINHELLARLPIRVFWTTNYDTKIEDALKERQKRVHVRITPENLGISLRGADPVVYKMHGDVSLPHEAVLTKEDFETYSDKREPFEIRLKSDLISQTFLFLGYSFSDPNIDHILGRIRGLLGQNTPSHYCIMRRPKLPPAPTPEQKEKYEYECRKLELRIDDLGRYRIHAVIIDEFDEITEILKELNQGAFLDNVFVSGSAAEGSGKFDLPRLQEFTRKLARRLIKDGLRVISGYGFGIGSELIVGVMEEAADSLREIGDRLVLRPFPRSAPEEHKAEVYRKWREAMLSEAGFAIFIAGNKLDRSNDCKTVILSDGVKAEFTASQGKKEKQENCGYRSYPIPVGATHYMAEKLWQEVIANQAAYYGNMDVGAELNILGDENRTDAELMDAIFKIIDKVRTNRAQ